MADILKVAEVAVLHHRGYEDVAEERKALLRVYEGRREPDLGAERLQQVDGRREAAVPAAQPAMPGVLATVQNPRLPGLSPCWAEV